MNEGLPFSSMGLVSKWIYALKIKSWPKLLVPCFLGQFYGIAESGNVHLVPLLFGFSLTIFLLGYIVLLNDFADETVDTIKRTRFPDSCSPKTIPDKILSRNAVFWAGLIFGGICLFLSLIADFLISSYLFSGFALISLLVFAGYSLPPIRLNYRGGGEILELGGVGLVLPLFHFFLQNGIVFSKSYCFLLGISTLFACASALASGLSDEESDREGGKTTFVLLLGNQVVRNIIASLMVVSSLLLGSFLYIYLEMFSSLGGCLILFVNLYFTFQMFRWHKSSVTNAFSAQKHYKDQIHFAIWGSLFLIGFIRLLLLPEYNVITI